MAEEQSKNGVQDAQPVTDRMSAITGFLKRHGVLIAMGGPLLVGVFNAGAKLESIQDVQSQQVERFKSVESTLTTHGTKLDSQNDMLIILCTKMGCDLGSTHPHPFDLEPGTASVAPPKPHSKIDPPAAVAQKEKAAPISDSNRTTY
jgi:hypothetical protein